MADWDNIKQPEELDLEVNLYQDVSNHEDFKEEHGVHMVVWHPNGDKIRHSFDREHIQWKDARKLLSEVTKATQGYQTKCHLIQELAGTKGRLLVNEESKCYDPSVINYPGTQQWQDMAASISGWQWLHDNYGGFIHDYDFICGAAVEVEKGEYKKEE